MLIRTTTWAFELVDSPTIKYGNPNQSAGFLILGNNEPNPMSGRMSDYYIHALLQTSNATDFRSYVQNVKTFFEDWINAKKWGNSSVHVDSANAIFTFFLDNDQMDQYGDIANLGLVIAPFSNNGPVLPIRAIFEPNETMCEAEFANELQPVFDKGIIAY